MLASRTASPTPQFYTLSLPDALPISDEGLLGVVEPIDALDDQLQRTVRLAGRRGAARARAPACGAFACELAEVRQDRKSTRLNSSHLVISYAVFCLKKKKISI